MGAGQPPKFKTAEEMEEKIELYFQSLVYADDDGKMLSHPATITGLTLYLGFQSRQSLYDYGKNPKFSYTTTRARLRVENSYEQNLLTKNSSGAVFALKNFGWADNVKVDSTNVNLNTELSEEEKQEALDRVKEGLDEFKDYE